MPAGSTVRPQKWSDDVIDLYDDGEYSAIWGTYENSSSHRLGVRWNNIPDDPSELGFPNMGGYPLWYVEPEWLAKTILLAICDRVAKDPSKGKLDNILTALKECP